MDGGQGPVIYGFIGALITGVIAWVGMIIKYYITKGEKTLDEGGQIRLELRESNKKLAERLDAQRIEYEAKISQLRTDYETWKDKYYQDTVRLEKEKIAYLNEIAALKVQIADIKARFLTKGDAAAYA